MNRRWMAFGSASLLAAGLSGCLGLGGDSDEGGQAVKKAKAQTAVEGKIKVFAEFKDSFMDDFGSILVAKYPDMDLEVVSPVIVPGMDAEELRKETNRILDEEKPDLLFGSMSFAQWVKDERLLDLDPYIKQDKFDIETMHPAVVDTVRQMGGGRLYGLAHSFGSSALAYNKELFDRERIPYPKDGMTWEEVIALAKRFPANGEGENRIYGFYSNSPTPYDLISRAGGLAGLRVADPEGNKVTVQTEEWKRKWSLVIDAYRSGSIYLAPDNGMPAPGSTLKDNQMRDKFMIGQAAMTIVRPYSLDQFASYKSSGFKTFDWELVTEPVDGKRPGESNSFYAQDIFAIHAKAPNKKAAWEIIQYVNSDAFTKVFMKSASFRLLGNMNAEREKDGRSLEAFIKLKPGKTAVQPEVADNVPAAFSSSFRKLADEAAIAAANGSQTVDDALDLLQRKGQQALDQAKLSAGASGGGGK